MAVNTSTSSSAANRSTPVKRTPPKAAAPKTPSKTSTSASKPPVAAKGPSASSAAKAGNSSRIEPKDRVEVDFKGRGESGAVSSALLSGLRDNFGASPADSGTDSVTTASRAIGSDSPSAKESPAVAGAKDKASGEGIPITKDGRIIKPERQPGDEGRPGVIVADFFGDRNRVEDGNAPDVDGDGKADISHGANTAAQLHNDGFNVTGFDLGGAPHHKGVENLVEDIRSGKLGGNGEPITMSFGNDFDMKDFGKQFGLDLKPGNIKEMRGEIRKRMEEFAAGQDGDPKFQGPFSRDLIREDVSMMKSIDELQGMGHPVVGAASNVAGAFSPSFLFADKLVQATDYRGAPALGLSPDRRSLDPRGGERHNLTTDIPSLFTPRAVNGPDGTFQGISTNGDTKKAEVMPGQLTNGGNLANLGLIRGSSFAPSTAIRWAEQSNEYFKNIPQLSSFPERTGGVPRFDD